MDRERKEGRKENELLSPPTNQPNMKTLPLFAVFSASFLEREREVYTTTTSKQGEKRQQRVRVRRVEQLETFAWWWSNVILALRHAIPLRLSEEWRLKKKADDGGGEEGGRVVDRKLRAYTTHSVFPLSFPQVSSASVCKKREGYLAKNAACMWFLLLFFSLLSSFRVDQEERKKLMYVV